MTIDDGHRDDLNGDPGGRPVQFSLDGIRYLIYLNDANAAVLRQVFAPWVIAARRLGKTHGRQRAR